MQPAAPRSLPLVRLPDRRAGLFTPGGRLGWVFRDRRSLMAPYPEPPPDPQLIADAAVQRAVAARTAYRRVRVFWGYPSGGLLLVLLLAAGCAAAGGGAAAVTIAAALVICGPGIAVTAVLGLRSGQAAAAARAGSGYGQAVAAWEYRAGAWDQAEAARVQDADEWGSAAPPPGTGRADVFGGSLAGWQSLLMTHGCSALAAAPLLVMDLTGEALCGELAGTAMAAGVPVAEWLLPADLGESGLLAGLSGAQFADALVEAVHAGEPGAARVDRAVDTRVLEQLHGALGTRVTAARLAAAVRAALGHADRDSPLTPAEQALIGGELFPADYRRQVEPNLVRVEAFLADLARHDDPDSFGVPRPPAYLTCLTLESAARSARGEVLAALAVGWLTVQVTGSAEPAPAVIIAGADEISRPHLERLSAACERRGVPLTLLFRHLRDAGLDLLGGGATGFMRLGNHREAEHAAAYIGRQHRFVLSQLTATHGGSHTGTLTRTEGGSVTDTITVGWHTGWNSGRSASRSGGEGGGTGSSSGQSGGKSGSRGRSVSRNWSTAWSDADGTSWSDAQTRQRVYEYAVEPAILQNLPDNALLLVTRGAGGPVLQSVECDPAIITLPGVSTAPLPPPGALPPPGYARPAIGPAGDGWPRPAAQPGQDPRPVTAGPPPAPPAAGPPPRRPQWPEPPAGRWPGP